MHLCRDQFLRKKHLHRRFKSSANDPSGPQLLHQMTKNQKSPFHQHKGCLNLKCRVFQPIIPQQLSGTFLNTKERKEPIPSAQGLTPLPLPSPQQVISSGT
jgi:hypothetical protein